MSTVHGDRLWGDGGWPGSCHEPEFVTLSGLEEVLDTKRRGEGAGSGGWGMAMRREHGHALVGDRRTKGRLVTGNHRGHR